MGDDESTHNKNENEQHYGNDIVLVNVTNILCIHKASRVVEKACECEAMKTQRQTARYQWNLWEAVTASDHECTVVQSKVQTVRCGWSE